MLMKSDKRTKYIDPDSLGPRMRARRIAPLVELIDRIHKEKGAVSILDVGGRESYWKCLDPEFLRSHGVTITILNLPSDLAGQDNDLFKYAVGDACDLGEYPDDSFDIVHSNSVIEHVGNWEKVKAFARETRRVAPNLFIQTPYFWFPVEPHFVKVAHHWLPKSLRVSMWLRFKMGERGRARNIDEAMHKLDGEPYLLDMRMFRYLFPDCEIIKERFYLFTKSLVAFRQGQGSNGSVSS